MIRINRRPIVYVPRVLRSKAPTDTGRAFVVWYARVSDRNVFLIGTNDALLRHGRDRSFDNIRLLGGDFIPLRRLRYWPTNIEKWPLSP